MGTFVQRARELQDQVGHGTLSMRVVVDQVYAKYQELREDLDHPRGGIVHALRDSGPAGPEQDRLIGELAQSAITPAGSRLRQGAEELAERICTNYERLAPVEFTNLRRSTHPIVTDDGAVAYDRAPYVHRLSEAELRAQRRAGHALDYGAETRPRGSM